MRYLIGLIVVLFMPMPSSAFAQALVNPITPAAVCSPPPPAQSCKQLQCNGPCTEKWVEGRCVGGLCPKGIMPTSIGTDLTIHNVTPELEQKIRSLLDSKQ